MGSWRPWFRFQAAFFDDRVAQTHSHESEEGKTDDCLKLLHSSRDMKIRVRALLTLSIETFPRFFGEGCFSYASDIPPPQPSNGSPASQTTLYSDPSSLRLKI